MNNKTKASYKLPPKAYYDQAWFDNEKRNIFGL